jgi:hypothetical protein
MSAYGVCGVRLMQRDFLRMQQSLPMNHLDSRQVTAVNFTGGGSLLHGCLS